MLRRADAAKRSRRIGDDADRLAEKRALTIGTRADIDCVLEHAGDRAIVFGRDEQYPARFLQLFAKRHPVRRWCGFEVLIEEGDVMQRRDIKLERGRRELGQRICDLEREALLAKTADDGDDGMRAGHEMS